MGGTSEVGAAMRCVINKSMTSSLHEERLGMEVKSLGPQACACVMLSTFQAFLCVDPAAPTLGVPVMGLTFSLGKLYIAMKVNSLPPIWIVMPNPC